MGIRNYLEQRKRNIQNHLSQEKQRREKEKRLREQEQQIYTEARNKERLKNAAIQGTKDGQNTKYTPHKTRATIQKYANNIEQAGHKLSTTDYFGLNTHNQTSTKKPSQKNPTNQDYFGLNQYKQMTSYKQTLNHDPFGVIPHNNTKTLHRKKQKKKYKKTITYTEI